MKFYFYIGSEMCDGVYAKNFDFWSILPENYFEQINAEFEEGF
jgi:hypothetical protein